jgi:magnesium transporter
MTSALKKRIKKYGLPPGTLIHTGLVQEQAKVRIQLIDYNADNIRIKDRVPLEECLDSMSRPEPTWINISGIHDVQMVEKIGRRLGLHPLLLEDVLNSGQRSKIDDYKDTLYIVLRKLSMQNDHADIDDQQVSIILGSNFLITFLESDSDFFSPILERLKIKNSRMRSRGVDYLAYAIVDCLVDHYFLTLEKIDDLVERFETAIVEHPGPKILKGIQQLKRQVSHLKKAIWPTREVVSKFIRIESPLVRDTTKVYLQDVYDHVIQAIDTIESFRDASSGMVEIYISNINSKMNEVMKVLTVVATIFVPLTFISSLYGMNFSHMPELEWEWGYYAVLAFMAACSFGMWRFFKKKQWI